MMWVGPQRYRPLQNLKDVNIRFYCFYFCADKKLKEDKTFLIEIQGKKNLPHSY